MGQTITEKIFAAHLRDTPTPGNMVLDIDVIMCHEITTPIAIMDLMDKGMDRVCDPARIKAVIDHVTPPKDSKTAAQAKIMREWARRHNIRDFFDIGRNGVCHALFPEKGFIRPGNTVIMGDSHTCTHGAFGAFAAGVGTTDLEVAIYKGVCAFRAPKSIKIEVTGTLPKGVVAKDVILNIIKELTMGGGTDMVIEFTGPVVDAMNMASRMTLCNMAVEAGATSGVCQPDLVTAEYLWPFIKDDHGHLIYSAEKGDFKYGENVRPTYKWYNGVVHQIALTDKIDDSKILELNRVEGSASDPNARIWPFKVMVGKQPYDPVNKTLVVNHVYGNDDTAFWGNFDYEKSIKAGMDYAGLPYSGQFGFIETRMNWFITHMVAPKEDAVRCKECHTRAEDGRLVEITDIYLPGRDRSALLDRLGFGLAGLMLVGAIGHGSLRFLSRNKRNKEH